jgi:TolB-like protein/tetratricopeptide (TPR) repeat protein/DNA-binding winged helix-turn-helix (wHTH) protein
VLRVDRVHNELLNGFLLLDKRVHPLTGSVCSDSAETHLPSRSMEVLLFLARNPRTLVSREELLEKVWGNSNASPAGLGRAISEIRHALDDHADHPVFIQTVPKRGYRLLVEPELIGENGESADTMLRPDRLTLVGNLMARGVIQASVAFVIVGWVLIQVADAVVPIVGLPGWTVPFVTYTVIGGLPVVILFAWFFEYAEGRFYLDRGKASPTITSGIGKNYLTMVAAYAITAFGALVYQFSVGFEVPGESRNASIEIIKSDVEVEPNSIAVLKFINIDGSDKSEIFSHGFAEDVLDRLARVPGLLVSARGDSWSLPPNSPSEEVRRRLRVAYYLEGSVRLIGDELRVVAQLIDSNTGFHVVSRSFDKKLEDFVEVQDEITTLTVANLRVALPEDTQMIPASDYGDTDVDAYVLYRRGKEVLQSPSTPELLKEAKEYFEQALRIDPEYAAAYAGICITNGIGYEITGDATYISAAEAACERALAKNPNLYMVYAALGDLYLLTGRNTDAETAFERALDINGKDVQAIQGLSTVYELQQRFDEAEALLNESIRLQPGNWRSADALGGFLFANGRYVEAADAYRQVVLLDPGNWQGHGNLGSALLMAGQFEPAAAALKRALEIEPDQYYFSNLAIINYYTGQYDDAVAIHRKAIELSPDSNTSWLNLGDALLFSSEADQAQEAFRISAELARKNLAVNPMDALKLYELAWAVAMLGDVDESSELINRSKALDPENPYVHYFDALIKHHTGRDNAAIDALKTAVESGYPVVMLQSEPHLSGLRDLPDFHSLISSPSDGLH